MLTISLMALVIALISYRYEAKRQAAFTNRLTDLVNRLLESNEYYNKQLKELKDEKIIDNRAIAPAFDYRERGQY